MIRVSFRQSMLAGFLLIVALLGAASVRSWFLLERFAAQSRSNGELALRISASTQELAERTTELERGARQYMVLRDPSVLARFDALVSRTAADETPEWVMFPPVIDRRVLDQIEGRNHAHRLPRLVHPGIVQAATLHDHRDRKFLHASHLHL